jgi:hypothetical protein
MSTNPSDVDQAGCNELLEQIEKVMQSHELLSSFLPLPTLPLLAAARSCTLFHEIYSEEVRRLSAKVSSGKKQRVNSLEVVQRLVYNEILCKIEESLSPIQPADAIETGVSCDGVRAAGAQSGCQEEVKIVSLISTESNRPAIASDRYASAGIALFDDDVSFDSKSK